MALDLFFFFIFFEAIVVPMFFLIAFGVVEVVKSMLLINFMFILY